MLTDIDLRIKQQEVVNNAKLIIESMLRCAFNQGVEYGRNATLSENALYYEGWIADSAKFKELIMSHCGKSKKFAREVGLTESMVSNIIYGRKRITQQHLENFSKVLNVDKGDIIALMKGGVQQ